MTSWEVKPGPLFATLTLSLGLYLVFGPKVCGWFLMVQGVCLLIFTDVITIKKKKEEKEDGEF